MTPREHAALAVETATTALDDARKWLREEAKAEIAALNVVASDGGFFPMTTAIAAVLGDPEITNDDDQQLAWWCFAPSQWVSLSRWHDGFRVEACHLGALRRGEWRLSDMTLDAAVKAALLWLADRDVFVDVKR